MPSPRSAPCDAGAADRARADGSATLDVLTYNVEGLPWPARSGRANDLRRIGDMLRRLNADGHAPDVVLFQEAFSSAAIKAVEDAGYATLVAGPSRTQRSKLSSDVALPGRARLKKGELGIRLMTSGLVIASRYPVIASASASYSRGSCAGFDCLANKGALLVQLVVPGAPDPIFLVNTHMNAQRASKVAPARHLAAHHAQSEELSQFLDRHWDRTAPLIIGGDFNMRRAPARFDYFTGLDRFGLVHQYCVESGKCDVRLSWDGDEPWMDTQDLQFFASGVRTIVRPIRVEAMFDGRVESPKLSDHDGFRVTYRLRWKDAGASANLCAPAEGAGAR